MSTDPSCYYRALRITGTFLRQFVDYDPISGIFLRKPILATAPGQIGWNARFAGKPTGTLSRTGYIMISIHGIRYQGHVLAWLWMTGAYPAIQIDHKDTNRSNNAFSNLREANGSQQASNRRVRRDSLLRVKGISMSRRSFRARITFGGQRHSVGNYPTLEAAQLAVMAYRQELHGEFCNHG